MEYASNGKGNAALALGIIGTALGGIDFLKDGSWNFGCGTNTQTAALEAEVAELKGMRYTDQVGIDLYKAIVAQSNNEDAKLNAATSGIYNRLIELEKQVALNAQATAYENTILSNKICCNKQLGELADASILSYVNSNFLPGTLYLPASSIAGQTNN